MAGHIRRRGNSYQVIVTVRDQVTQKPRQLSASRKTKREAEAALAELLVSANRGSFVSGEGSVADMLSQWVRATADHYAPATRCLQRSTMNVHLLPYFANVPMRKCTAVVIGQYVRDKMASGLAPASVNRHRNLLDAAFTWAVQHEMTTDNPVKGSVSAAGEHNEMVVPSPEQVAKIISTAAERNPKLALFLRLAATTGARRGELCALQWNDVDFPKGEVVIGHSMSASPDGGYVRKSTKTGRPRRIGIDAVTLERLQIHYDLERLMLAQAGRVLPEDGYVFTGARGPGSCWDLADVSHYFRDIADQVGVDKVRLHDIRHYAATQMIGAGLDIRTVAGRLGHSNVATTLNTYAAFLPSRDREAADVLAGTIGGV